MFNKPKHPHLLYLLLAPLVGLVTITLRTLALFTQLEDGLGLYIDPTLSIINAIILVLLTASLAVFTYEMRSHYSFRRDYRDLPTLFSGVFLAIVLVFLGVTMIVDASGAPLPTLLTVIPLALAALAGSLLFVLRAFDGAAEGAAKAMLSLPIAALGVLFALYLSVETSQMLNAPAKLLGIATWVTVTFFFLGESRIALGRAKWALHSFVTVVTIVFTATLSLPNLIYHAATGVPLIGNTAHDFAAFGIFLYALARLISTAYSAIRQTAPGAAIVLGEASNQEEARNEETADR